jgi:class 3 adenylate cyclase
MRSFARGADERRERVLGTILITDIVDSTALASALGPSRWRELLAQHNERAQRVLDRHLGRLIKTTGDGLLALFDGTERAVDAAAGIRDAVGQLDIQIRAGLHTGEVELVPGDVRGLAIHVAARIMSLAAPGEVLVSSTVRELLDGSDLVFEDRGTHELKGINGARQVFVLARRPG